MQYCFEMEERFSKIDFFAALIIGGTYAAWSIWLNSLLGIEIFGRGAFDLYLDADTPRIYKNLFLSSEQIWDDRHPLIQTLIVLPVRAFMFVSQIGPEATLLVLIAAFAATWGALFYLALRVSGFERIHSILFTAFAALTSSSIIFLPIIETFILGSMGILLSSLLVTGSRRRIALWGPVNMAIGYGITLTNIIPSVTAILIGQETWKRKFKVFLLGGALIAVITGIQFFPGYPFPSKIDDPVSIYRGNQRFLSAIDFKRSLSVGRSFFLDSIVTPEPRVSSLGYQPYDSPNEAAVTFRKSTLSRDPWAIPALISWISIFALGAYALFASKTHKKARLFLLLTLLFNLFLHLKFGEETFLYNMHWMPLLVWVGAYSLTLRWRKAVTALLLIAMVCVGIHNYRQFNKMVGLLKVREASAPLSQKRQPALTLLPNGAIASEDRSFQLFQSDEAGMPLINSLSLLNIARGVWLFKVSPDVNIGAVSHLTLAPYSSARPSLWAIKTHPIGPISVNYRWQIRIPRKPMIGDEAVAPLFEKMWAFHEPNLILRFPSGRGYFVAPSLFPKQMRGCIQDTLNSDSLSWRECREYLDIFLN